MKNASSTSHSERRGDLLWKTFIHFKAFIRINMRKYAIIRIENVDLT